MSSWFILTASSHLLLNGLFHSGVPLKMLYSLLISQKCAISPAHIIPLNLINVCSKWACHTARLLTFRVPLTKTCRTLPIVWRTGLFDVHDSRVVSTPVFSSSLHCDLLLFSFVFNISKDSCFPLVGDVRSSYCILRSPSQVLKLTLFVLIQHCNSI